MLKPNPGGVGSARKLQSISNFAFVSFTTSFQTELGLATEFHSRHGGRVCFALPRVWKSQYTAIRVCGSGDTLRFWAATSASTERLFSIAGRSYDDLRQRMKEEMLAMLMWARVKPGETTCSETLVFGH